jgi:pyoverdine/dityrosine biosynthesis protein Dit1
LGSFPDRGEELSLLRLQSFCERVKQFYAPGCEVVLVTDGIVFADLIGVADEQIDAYWQRMQSLVPAAVNVRFDSIHSSKQRDCLL